MSCEKLKDNVHTEPYSLFKELSVGDRIGLLTGVGRYFELDIVDRHVRDIGKAKPRPRIEARTREGEAWELGYDSEMIRHKYENRDVVLTASWAQPADRNVGYHERDPIAVYYDEECPDQLPEQDEVLTSMEQELSDYHVKTDELQEMLESV